MAVVLSIARAGGPAEALGMERARCTLPGPSGPHNCLAGRSAGVLPPAFSDGPLPLAFSDGPHEQGRRVLTLSADKQDKI